MRKLTLKLDRDQLTTLAGLIKVEIEQLDHRVLEPETGWALKVLRAVLRDVVLNNLLRKLLLPRLKYTVSFKEHEAECLNVAIRTHEIRTADPYKIALIEKIKQTPLI